jgi:hypothetical protein
MYQFINRHSNSPDIYNFGKDIYIYQYLDEMLGCERDIFFTIDNYEITIKYSLSYFSEVFTLPEHQVI